jgi:DNA-directed RNA polymerase subunit F
MEVKSSRGASLSEAKEILTKRKDAGEMGYEQTQALDNSERFSKDDASKVAKLVDALVKKGKLTEEAAVKVADIRPDSAATLKAVLLKDRIELTEEEIETVLKEVS